MNRAVWLTLPAWFWILSGNCRLSAQNLVITNARIIIGNGTVIDRGSIVIRNGRLASVAAGKPNVSAVEPIDPRGMLAMPGFFEGHRHLNTRRNEKLQLQELLDAD